MSEPDDDPTPAVEVASSGADPRPSASHWSGRRGTRVAALGLLVSGLVALGTGGALRQLTDTSVPPRTAPPSATLAATTSAPALRATPDGDEQRVTALQALLTTRARAVLEHDEQAWLSTIDPQAAEFKAKQATVFANLQAVPFAVFSYEFDGVASPLSAARRQQLGESAWVARVIADHRIEGYDRGSSQTELYLTSVQRQGSWYLTADTDGATVPELWDLGRVRVVRGDDVLVLGTADLTMLKSFASQGDKAVDRVTKVWGQRWPRRAVLVVPRTEAEMGKLLQRTDGLDQVAAVTTGELSGTGSGVAGSDRVVVNPAAFSRLGVVGRRVVLTHEMTHVAVRSSTAPAVPIWLSEGFADYVGYQGVGLGRRTVAADVLALTRQGEGFTALPIAEDFDPARTTIAPAYSAAWLACSLIADRYGRAALVKFYRAAATSEADDPEAAVSKAFASVLGTSESAFTKTWLDYLAQLAAA